MAYKKLNALIVDVELKLSQSAGTSVQKYGQPRIAMKIQDSFDSLFKKRFWPQFCEWYDVTLDGVTGVPTSDQPFDDFGDIRVAYPKGQGRKLKQTPLSINPNMMTGTSALYIEGKAGPRKFRCWPKETTDIITLHARVHPGIFALTDTVPFDPLCISLMAAWSYAVDDGHNPQQIEALRNLFTTHLSLIEDSLGEIPYDLDPRFPNQNTQWTEIG